MTKTEAFDIILVGGGLAGGLAALAVAARGFSCALVDSQDPDMLQHERFDGRTTAIAYASARAFRRLGLWDALSAYAEPINDIVVADGRARNHFDSGAGSTFSLHFNSRDLAPQTPLGWIIENRYLRQAIFNAVKSSENITLYAPAARAATMFGPAAANVTLHDGRRLTAPLAAAADGRFSGLRAEANIKVNQWRYQQTGIVATIAHDRPHNGVAYELFLPAGPFAILPMTTEIGGAQHRSSIVWTERADSAAAYLELDDDDFVTELQNRFGDFLGSLRLSGPRWSYPLAFHLAQRFIADRLVLLGDAARAIHPIAGQGYNLAVKDAAALSDVLSEARSVGLDIGHMSVLEKYQRWRRFDSASLALGTDFLNRLFSNDIAPLRLMRGLGLGAVAQIAPARNFFMRQAGGDLGTLPSLMAHEQ